MRHQRQSQRNKITFEPQTIFSYYFFFFFFEYFIYGQKVHGSTSDIVYIVNHAM